MVVQEGTQVSGWEGKPNPRKWDREAAKKAGFTDDMIDWVERETEIIPELLAKGIPPVTAHIMASDRVSAERLRSMMAEGKVTPQQAVSLTGSYARLDQALRLVEEGHLDSEWLIENLPSLWRDSDPDDTDDRLLRLWIRAFVANGNHTLTDGRPLPKDPILHVYRGQDPNAMIGMAWSLDPKVARKFALTNGLRERVEGGAIIHGEVRRQDVYAYLTGRGESECVVHPGSVTILKIVPIEE